MSLKHGFRTLTALLIVSTLLFGTSLLLVPDGARVDAGSDDQVPTRSQKFYLEESGIFIPPEYDRDEMWLVVYVQNKDAYPGDSLNSDDVFQYREVANSLAIPMDGDLHSSGNVRRPLVELFTSTNCPYCPGAEGSLDQIMDERTVSEFTLLELHRGSEDPYRTTFSENRFIKYGVEGTPTVIFDGENGLVGGDPSANSPDLKKAYEQVIDALKVYDPYVAISGLGAIDGNYATFNVSFEVIGPMPKGNWTLSAIVCEDLHADHSGAELRHTDRYSSSRRIDGLQDGHPDVMLDEDATLEGVDPEEVRGNISIYWTAQDREDGQDVSIDVLYAVPGQKYQPLAEDLPNSGEFRWDTTKWEDDVYAIRILGEDSDGNKVLSRKQILLTVDNPDLPEGHYIFPVSGSTLKGSAVITWDATDDEDAWRDLLVRVSISNDTGETWKVISYNVFTESEFIPNENEFRFNTLNYEDKDTYQLRLEVKDTDKMVTVIYSDIFEIYNNDRPTASILSPSQDSTVTGTLDVGWRVSDEEDKPSDMTGNLSIKRSDKERWTQLYFGPLDDDMDNMTFSTDQLSGDGEYTLRLTVTDSRNLSHSSEVTFNVFDPDPPVLLSLTGPEETEDIRENSIALSWTSDDPDEDDIMTYHVQIKEVGAAQWRWAGNTSDTEYDLDLTGLDQGRYMVKVTVEDLHGLTDSLEFGPFYYDLPEAPELEFISPGPDLTGKIDSNWSGTDVDEDEFVVKLEWSVYDPDDDDVMVRLYYREGGTEQWTQLSHGVNLTSYEWDMTEMPDGEYEFRVLAYDRTPGNLSRTVTAGPFTIDSPFYPVISDDDTVDDDDDGGGSGEGTDEGVSMGLIIAIAVGSILVVVIIAIVVIMLLAKAKRSKQSDVIPGMKDVDLSIPDFQREGPVPQPVTGGLQGQPPEAQMIPDAQQQQAAPQGNIDPGPQQPSLPSQQVQGQYGSENLPQQQTPDQVRQDNAQDPSSPEMTQELQPPSGPYETEGTEEPQHQTMGSETTEGTGEHTPVPEDRSAQGTETGDDGLPSPPPMP